MCISLLLFNSLVGSCALFRKFPQLETKIPYISLGDLPTPVIKLNSFSCQLGYPSDVYMKRDDLTGKKENQTRLYGGNKVRKLEWLLADALNNNARTIVTYGCAGSNHALATAVYCNELGLNSILLLRPQPNSDTVRQNLLLDGLCNADLRYFADRSTRDAACKEIISQDPCAYFIPTGGSNPLGTLGFVNAVCELCEQIERGELAEPDVIYVPLGSCGTTVGLILGIMINNLKTKVVAVAVEPEDYEPAIKELFINANTLLHTYDNSIPLFDFPEEKLVINTKHSSIEYGLWTQSDAFAVQQFKKLENIQLDGTYSTKPISAFIQDVADGVITNQVVLIWNTYCGLDFSTTINNYVYTLLPQPFHRYFETDVQILNQFVQKKA